MHTLLVDRLGELAGLDGFVVLGGTPEVVSAVAKQTEGNQGLAASRCRGGNDQAARRGR